MTDQVIQPVLSHYGLGGSPVRIEPLANAGGWSGSRLWRITDVANRQLCLRRWPVEHPTPERLQFIHNVLLRVAPDLPIVAFPLRTHAGATFVHHSGYLWELTNWLPGIADFQANPSTIRLRAAMQALAMFHKLATRFQTQSGPAPAIADRLQQLQKLDRGELARIEQAISRPLDRELDERAERMFAALKQRLERQLPACPISPTSYLPLQPAIRDIHHEHVLFTGNTVTGLIDFGAMRIDTPLADIARLVGSLVCDDADARKKALDAYAELQPLNSIDCRLIDWLDQAGLILGAHNWLKWLYVERRDMGPSGPIAHRLDEITLRLAIK